MLCGLCPTSSAAAALGWDTEAIPALELKPNRLGTALDGDRVAVRVERKAARGRRNIRRDRFSSPVGGVFVNDGAVFLKPGGRDAL